MCPRSLLRSLALSLCAPLLAQAEAPPPAPPARLDVFPAAMYLARPDLDASLHLTDEQRAAAAAGEAVQLDEAQLARVARVAELHAQAVATVAAQLGKRLGQDGALDAALAARIAALLERKPEHLVPECQRLLALEEAQSEEALLRALEEMQAEKGASPPSPAPAPQAEEPSLLDALLRATTEELGKAAGREAKKALGGDDAGAGAAGEMAEAATRALLDELLPRKRKGKAGR